MLKQKNRRGIIPYGSLNTQTQMNKKEKHQKVKSLISEIHYQAYEGISTWGYCENKCGNEARGSNVCLNCLSLELEKLVGVKNSDKYVCALTTAKKLENEFNQIYVK